MRGASLTDQVTTPAPGAVRVVPAGIGHRNAALEVLRGGFEGSGFYRRLLGLDEPAFGSYWRSFVPFVLADPHARVYALEVEARARGFLCIGLPGFGTGSRALAFLGDLARRTGPLSIARYLSFVRAYEQRMHVPTSVKTREGRGLWLAVDPDLRSPVAGARLVREALEQLRREGITTFTGLADGGSPGILAFYRRLEFTLHPVPPYRGCRLVRVVREAAGSR